MRGPGSTNFRRRGMIPLTIVTIPRIETMVRNALKVRLVTSR
jgi:hypothetical protein